MNQGNETQFSPVDVTHDDFRKGLPHGRYRVVVNPERAAKYVQHRLAVKILALPVLGIGIALGLSGYLWAGIFLVITGFLVPRLIRKNAPALLLHLAMNNEGIFREAIEFEILEVRSASST